MEPGANAPVKLSPGPGWPGGRKHQSNRSLKPGYRIVFLFQENVGLFLTIILDLPDIYPQYIYRKNYLR